jgi:hypothetical protein
MRANLASRLRRLETRLIAASEPRPIVQFADVARLPRSYVGERHLVQIDRPGSERLAYEERPGPGRISKPIPTPSWCSSCRARGSRRLLLESPLLQYEANTATRSAGIACRVGVFSPETVAWEYTVSATSRGRRNDRRERIHVPAH